MKHMESVVALDFILMICLGGATCISGYMTFQRIFLHNMYMSYDSWVFAMCLGLTLQMIDNFSKATLLSS